MQDALRFVESCIDRYAEQAWRAAYVMLSNAADADDLLQQAFLVAWRKADTAPRDNTWPWLATIIANEARNFRRKRARRRGVSLQSIGEPAMRNDPDQQLQRAELSALVHVSLAELGEEQRIAIVLTHLSGLSQSQAADALGLPLNTLKSRVRRGLDSMRDALGKHAPGLEGTLKNLHVGAPPGGFIAAKAAWSASLATNAAAVGTVTAAGAAGIKTVLATAVAALVLTTGVLVAVAMQPKESPPPQVTAAMNTEPVVQAANEPEPEPVIDAPPTQINAPPTRIERKAPPLPESEPRHEPTPLPAREAILPDPTPSYVPPSDEPPPSTEDAEAKKKRQELFGKSLREEIEAAVDAGCDWVKQQQGIDPADPKPVFGTFPENSPTYGKGTPHRYLIARTAFPIQALCMAGCFVDEKEIDTAMNWLRENYTGNGAVDSMQGFVDSTTYEDATLLLAVEAYYISAWETKEAGLSNPKKRYTKDEEGNKVPIKRWGTEEKGAKKKKVRDFKLDRKDQKMCEIAVKALESRFRKAYGGGGWRYAKYGAGDSNPDIDVSATQYAILGLTCASRLGIKYDKGMLIQAFRFLRGQQDEDGPVVKAKWKLSANDDDDKKKKDRGTSSEGEPRELKARGWGYARQSTHAALDKETYGSMTAAGVNALILIRDELIEDPGQKRAWEVVEEECNQMIGDGLAWMIQNWSMQENPRAGHYRFYYYLYTVERLGMLGGIDEIGGHDWYIEGAEVLLKDQDASGMWDIQNEIDPSDIYNTCYALLFLKRTTARVDQLPPVIVGTSE